MDAFQFASDHTVRAILKALCDDSDVRTKALSYLAKLEPLAIQVAQAFPQVKRKITSGLSICVQCESSFDEADNTAKVCQYHNGDLEPDYDSDFWADHDERCHGIIDSDFCRKEYPDGFLWTCCDEIGTHPGCKFSRHQSEPERSKRRRCSDSASESSSAKEGDGDGSVSSKDDDSEGEEDEEEDGDE